MSDLESLEDVSSIDYDSEVDGVFDESVLAALTVERYKPTTLPRIASLLESMIERAADVTGLAAGTTQLLLNAYGWDTAELTSDFLDEQNRSAQRAGLRSAKDLILLSCGSGVSKGKGKKECPICYTETTDLVALGCNHSVCRSCFKLHISTHTLGDRKIYKTSCPGSLECPLLVTSDTVKALLGDKGLAQYEKLSTELFLGSRRGAYRYCPHPDCDVIIQKLDDADSRLGGVTCSCGREFCFECGLPYNHYAVPCDMAKTWLALVDHEHQSEAWIMQNTKACPECESKIQRIEGCNHMVCGSCRFEFCWVCSQSWASHSGRSYYNCVKYVPDSTKGVTSSKKQQDRLRFYVMRYDNHAALGESMEDGFVRYVHRMISWTYVLLYLGVHANSKVILEELVTDLVRDIENASPRLKQRAQALDDFVMNTTWKLDPSAILRFD